MSSATFIATLNANGTIHPNAETAYGMAWKYTKNVDWILAHVFDSEGNKHPDWNVMVVIRDPAERLVSGFLNKCVGDHWTDACHGNFTDRSQFGVFANEMITAIQKADGGYPDLNHHFGPQWTNGGLIELYPTFVDTMLKYDRSTIGEQTLRYLQENGEEDMFYGYGAQGNLTLFDEETKHATRQYKAEANQVDALEAECAFYREFYDEELLNAVMEAFHYDYSLFNLDGPAWEECIKKDNKLYI